MAIEVIGDFPVRGGTVMIKRLVRAAMTSVGPCRTSLMWRRRVIKKPDRISERRRRGRTLLA